MYICKALFQNMISANPKIEFVMSITSSEINFWKRSLHMYMYIYIYICENLFFKTQFANLELTFKTVYLSWR